MTAYLFKTPLVRQLKSQLGVNQDRYWDGSFTPEDVLFTNNIMPLRNVSIDQTLFRQMQVRKQALGISDAENALLLYQGLSGVTPKLARDQRFWVTLCHLDGHGYIKRRHDIFKPDETKIRNSVDYKRYLAEGGLPAATKYLARESIKSLETRFFCTGNRGFERDNALARLWWAAHVTSSFKSLKHAEALTLLMEKLEIRSVFLDNATVSIIPNMLEALLLCVKEEKKKNDDLTFFKSREHKDHRVWMELINKHGGRASFETMSTKDLFTYFWNLRGQV